MKAAFPVLALGISGVLFLACFPSLDGLTGGVADGGSGADTGGKGDAGVDVAALDGAASIEAGPWCATNGAPGSFCCDFDTDDLTVFNDTKLYNGATVSLDTEAASSPPRSLLVKTPVNQAASPDAGAFSEGHVHYISTPGATAFAEVALTFRIDKAATLQSVGLVVFRFVGPDRNYEARLLLETDRRLFISEFDTKTLVYAEPFRASTPIPVGTWVRAKFRVELLASGSGRADLEIDGTPVATAVTLKPFHPKGELRTDIGATYVKTPNDGWTVRIDDLLISPK